MEFAAFLNLSELIEDEGVESREMCGGVRGEEEVSDQRSRLRAARGNRAGRQRLCAPRALRAIQRGRRDQDPRFRAE